MLRNEFLPVMEETSTKENMFKIPISIKPELLFGNSAYTPIRCERKREMDVKIDQNFNPATDLYPHHRLDDLTSKVFHSNKLMECESDTIKLRYVVDSSCDPLFAKEGRPSRTVPAHLQMADGPYAAGNVAVNNDFQITLIDNKSGGFRPNFLTILIALKAMFAKNLRFGDTLLIRTLDEETKTTGLYIVNVAELRAYVAQHVFVPALVQMAMTTLSSSSSSLHSDDLPEATTSSSASANISDGSSPNLSASTSDNESENESESESENDDPNAFANVSSDASRKRKLETSPTTTELKRSTLTANSIFNSSTTILQQTTTQLSYSTFTPTTPVATSAAMAATTSSASGRARRALY